MSNHIDGKAPEHFGWEKWLLGWINDLQVSCFSTGRTNVNLSPIGVVDTISLKIITVKLSETKAIVAESRRSTTYDKLTKEGVLVYLVDTSLDTLMGPIQVLPLDPSDQSKLNNILGVGESITYANVKVTLVSRENDFDNVEIIGRGIFGVVYKAKGVMDGIYYAVKKSKRRY